MPALQPAQGNKLMDCALFTSYMNRLTEDFWLFCLSRCLLRTTNMVRVEPQKYSSKVQQQCRRSAWLTAASPRSTSLIEAQRGAGPNFASKGLGVRVPLAPPLVKATFGHSSEL